VRTILRSVVVAGVAGVLAVAAAWAGIGYAPVPTGSSGDATGPVAGNAVGQLAAGTAAGGTNLAQLNAASLPALGAGQLLVGVSKTNIRPNPEAMKDKGYPDAYWERDPAKCMTMDPAVFDRLQSEPDAVAAMATHGIVTAGSPWPENPNCIYQGGFGIGPMNPVADFDKEYGLWVRALALSDGKDTTVLAVIDAEGWLWDYKSKCVKEAPLPGEGECGAKQLAAWLADKRRDKGVTEKSLVLHATHAHAAMDFIGGWGFVPDWYMAQVTEAIKATTLAAVDTMIPAVLQGGEIEARAQNSERRDTYRAAEEQQLGWLRFIDAQELGQGNDPRVIATMGAYAAHPTTKGNNTQQVVIPDGNGGTKTVEGNVAHADWPGLFEKRLEQRFGGIGLHFMTGLGNMSSSGGTGIGTKLADLLPGLRQAPVLTGSTDIRMDRVLWSQPITNVPLDALGTPGFFDRKFQPTPGQINVGESDTAPCTSASPQSVELSASAIKIGNDIEITAAPGEVFSNLTNTIKEKNPDGLTFPIAQANDALGYMPQSFEMNPVGQQGLGFAFGGLLFVNYEDSYAIDRCTGDAVLEYTLDMLGGL
jgi:hypothetical protein